MLKILWKREEIAPEEQFLLLFTMFSKLMLDFYVETRIDFFLRDKRLFEITEVEITRVDCIYCVICKNHLLGDSDGTPKCIFSWNGVKYLKYSPYSP